VRYRAVGTPSQRTSCHCLICRKTSGAPFLPWASFRRSDFGFTSEQPAFFESTPHGVRTFCATCGTPLTCELAEFPEEVDVTICSMDEPESLAPEDHTWTARQLPWVKLADRLPRHAGRREEG
jgi:hypothetical protein